MPRNRLKELCRKADDIALGANKLITSMILECRPEIHALASLVEAQALLLKEVFNYAWRKDLEERNGHASALAPVTPEESQTLLEGNGNDP
jgi:hypothetical protein